MGRQANAQDAPGAFLRVPDIHGDQIAFSAEGDLWLGSLKDHSAQRITSHPGDETRPRFSPDGKTLAFTANYDGGTDVYVMPTNGGEPRRLTYDPYGALVIGWTPDGSHVLYRSRDKNDTLRNQLLSVPAKGGMPAVMPVPTVEHAALNRDGHRLAYVPVSAEWQHWFRYRGGEADDIWLADMQAHTFKRLTDWPGVDTTPVWAGDDLYFVSERDGLANLYRLDTRTGKAAAVTHYADAPVAYPASDGAKIVFQHGRGLACYDPASGKTEELGFALHSDRIHARARLAPAAPFVHAASLGPTGKRVLIEARGQILSAPVESGDVRMIAPKPGSRAQYPAWSPDGKQAAFVSDRSGEEQVWLCPAMGVGEPRQLTRDRKGPLGPLLWSPDGKWIATTDRESRLLLIDAASGQIRQVEQARYRLSYDEQALTDYRFSPDGKWLAYARAETPSNQVICLYSIADATKTVLTGREMNSYAPSFDAGGKYLCFLSDRQTDRITGMVTLFSFPYTKLSRASLIALSRDTPSPFLIANDEEGQPDTPNPLVPTPPAAPRPASPAPAPAAPDNKPAIPAVDGKPAAAVPSVPPTLPLMKVDLDGLASRLIDVPVPAGSYSAVDSVNGRLLIYGMDETLAAADPATAGQLLAFDLKTKALTTLATHLSGYDLSADRKKLLLQSGAQLSVVDAMTGPVAPSAGRVDLSSAVLTLDPAAEWRQIFEESWRIARDFFYDPNMHGVNWQAVHRRYAAQMPLVGSRSDLNRVLGDLIAELNVGHAYVGGGDAGDAPRPVPMGYLGADLEPVPGKNAVRIARLLEGDGFDLDARSPLLTPGVNARTGDYILAIGGQPVRADQDIQALLVGTAGKIVTLTINSKPDMDGARQVRVRTLASEAQARYYAWAAGRREYVRTHGGENLGYIHIPDMTQTGMQEFVKHYYPNLDKDAIIYDVRNNGGGNISAILLVQMASRPYSFFSPRYGAPWSRVDWGFSGYSAALCNENSGSNAEEFCDAFQRLKLGPVFGARTWGGEVGSGGGYTLMDGGRLNIPNYGEWVPGENGKPAQWVIEGTGAQPDVSVEQDPAALLAGRDPQLDRAIAYLKAQIAKRPIVRPTPPPYPDKSGLNTRSARR